MLIVGIDPGYDRFGIAVIEKRSRKDSVLYSDCIQTSSRDPLAKRFITIGVELCRVLEKYQPNALAIETLFITKNQKTAMRVAEARGIVIYEAAKRDIPVSEYSPVQIKAAITSDGASGKDRVIKMVNLLVDLPQKKMLDDEYDAIAVALTHSSISKSPAK